MQQVTYTFCAICGAHCSAKATVEDGKLVKWEQDKDRGFHYLPCRSFKGLANKEIIESPDRCKYPMKRVGERGSGQWQRVSWDEALGDIAARLTEMKKKYGSEALGASVGEMKHFEFVWIHRFMSVFGSPNIATPHSL